MKPWVLPTAIAGSLLAGAFVGYVITERVLRARYEKILQDEVDRIESYYQTKVEEYEVPEDVVLVEAKFEKVETETVQFDQKIIETQQLAESLGYAHDLKEEEHIRNTTPVPDTPQSYSQGKMTVREAEPIDYESNAYKDLLAERSHDKPYIITIDEFMDEYKDYDKISFTYFEGDDVVADEREQPYEEVASSLGLGNLKRFGEWSQDADQVYIRNHKLEIDFEVTRDDRSFAEVVAGVLVRKDEDD